MCKNQKSEKRANAMRVKKKQPEKSRDSVCKEQRQYVKEKQPVKSKENVRQEQRQYA